MFVYKIFISTFILTGICDALPQELTDDGKVMEYKDVEFLLYTRDMEDDGNPLQLQPEEPGGIDALDVNKETVLILHGFMGSKLGKAIIMIRKAYLHKDGFNVVVVDWSKLSRGPWYASAVANSPVAAKIIAEALDHITEHYKGNDPKFHFIGFGLGGQVAGLVGNYVSAAVVAKITALNPPKPGFDSKPDTERLDPTDADFVQVIHTATGYLTFEAPLGHVDFYPNGGKVPQPGCEIPEGTKGKSLLRPMLTLMCSHLLSYLYYVESVYEPYAFPAVRCESWAEAAGARCQGSDVVYMGFSTPTSARGIFYLETNPTTPYGKTNVTDSSEEEESEELDFNTGADIAEAEKAEKESLKPSKKKTYSGQDKHKPINKPYDGKAINSVSKTDKSFDKGATDGEKEFDQTTEMTISSGENNSSLEEESDNFVPEMENKVVDLEKHFKEVLDAQEKSFAEKNKTYYHTAQWSSAQSSADTSIIKSPFLSCSILFILIPSSLFILV